jgi:hypothetical protein
MYDIRRWTLDVRCWGIKTIFLAGYKVVHNVFIGGGYSLPTTSQANLCPFFTPLKSPVLNNNFKQNISDICQLLALSTPLIITTKLINLKGVI